MSSGTTYAGQNVSLSVSLATSSPSQVAGLEWTFAYSSADFAGVAVSTGAAAAAAGKSVTCNGGGGSITCLVTGLNQTIIASGVVATAVFTVSPTTVSASSAVQMRSAVGTTPGATAITVSASGGSVAITRPQPASLSCAPGSVATPGASACTVTLTAAPAGSVSVGLSSSNPSVTAPSTVTVSSGASSANFTVSAATVSSDTSATLTASLNGGSATFSLGLTPPAALLSLSCTPAVLNPGGTSTCTVSLTKAATSALTINLSSSQAAVTVPSTVTVASGTAGSTFTATAGSVSSSTTATISAAAPGGSATANITVSPLVQPASLSCTPASVVTPGASACQVTLTATLSGGVSVSLSSSNPSATLPSTVAVNSGTSDANFTVTAATVSSSTSTTLIASLNGGSVTFSLGLTPPGSSVTEPPRTGLRFVPITPCRAVDTRASAGPFGAPTMTAGSRRSFAIPGGACSIPSTAQAYALNVTVVPEEPLSYLTLWPTGQTQPVVSTLNSWDGSVVANAAIVPAGTGGAVSVYVTDATDVVLDINGYFDTSNGSSSYAFYPQTPCRVADTRDPAGQFGGPTMDGPLSRDFPFPLSACAPPAVARAYSVNVTAVPDPVKHFLGYLTVWPTGLAKPGVSTLNSWTGKVVANAALVPAGTNESISVFVTDRTDVILDMNGYFAAPGSSGALAFYPVAPCRIADTRDPTGPFGGPKMEAQELRSFAIPASRCDIPSTAAAYSLNVTVVPDGILSYLTAWPTGTARPNVSTLNSWDGSVTANAAIVPAGTGGAIDVFVTNPTHVVLDINGYFAP